MITKLKKQILDGYQLTKEEALALYQLPSDQLCTAANEIRIHFCANEFDTCTIINGKSGRCSENCKFCAQSSFYKTCTESYPLLNTEEFLAQAQYNEVRGVRRYSIVTSGRALSDVEVNQACISFQEIRKHSTIALCASFGLLTKSQYMKLHAAGVARIHNNLETSRRNFPNICTTHSYDDKVASIRAATQAGLEVCSGGLMGCGETTEDRIDMAFDLRDLGIRSIPLNLLSPIPGTPFEHLPVLTNEEMCRIVAIFRFILPTASIRLAGGRSLLPDSGTACFQSGANAAITGDLLTTTGATIEEDLNRIRSLGYRIATNA